MRSRSSARWWLTRSRPARDTSSSTSRSYPYLVDPRGRLDSAAVIDPEAVLDAALMADTAVVEGIPGDVTTALHICRGNYRSSWMCEGSLEPVAERYSGSAVRHVPGGVGRQGRDGGFEPIRFLREGAAMVMGLVSSKHRELEQEDDLVRRMEDAATTAGGMDRLAIAPAVRVRERRGRQRHR